MRLLNCIRDRVAFRRLYFRCSPLIGDDIANRPIPFAIELEELQGLDRVVSPSPPVVSLMPGRRSPSWTLLMFRAASIIYLRNGQVLALDCVNATKDYVEGLALVAGRLSPPAHQLADATVPLKLLASGASPDAAPKRLSTSADMPSAQAC